MQRLHRIPANRNHARPVARRKFGASARCSPVDVYHRVGHAIAPKRNWTRAWLMRRTQSPITAGNNPDVNGVIAALPPPGLASAHPRHPAPAEGVVKVPGSALVWHIPPRITRYPDV